MSIASVWMLFTFWTCVGQRVQASPFSGAATLALGRRRLAKARFDTLAFGMKYAVTQQSIQQACASLSWHKKGAARKKGRNLGDGNSGVPVRGTLQSHNVPPRNLHAIDETKVGRLQIKSICNGAGHNEKGVKLCSLRYGYVL